MTEKRIKFNTIIQNQLPSYVREEFPLVAEFLKQYYISQEFQGAPTDLIQNIDQYIKLDNIKDNKKSVLLASDISFSDDIIEIFSESGTIGFPDSYGLLQIDSEIISYTGKTQNSFTGCIRGFSGIISHKTTNSPDELEFSTSQSENHLSGSEVINLSSLFLFEFFNKIKYQISPGFENREFYSEIDKYLFLKQSKDFYSTRGTEESFKILFKCLYGEDVKVIRPQDFLVKPSSSQFTVTNDLVVDQIEGDPYNLRNATLFQDEYNQITKAYAPISDVEKILSKDGKEYYKLSFDAGYNRDIFVDGSLYGNFNVHPSTKLIGEVAQGSNTLNVDSTVGFPLNGELSITYANGTRGVITYTSKSINQFFGCANIVSTISDGSKVNLNTYARNEDSSIKVRITSILRDVVVPEDTYYSSKDDKAIIKDLGISPSSDDIISNSWLFNSATQLKVKEISVVDLTNKIYKIKTYLNHHLTIIDSIKLVSNDGLSYLSNEILSINSDNEIICQINGIINLSRQYSIQRNLLNVNYPNYQELENQISNIQNVYKDGEKTLVASSSLPSYKIPLSATNRSSTFDVNISTASIENPEYIFFIGNHNFYTGDLVYYTPGTTPLFDEGLYFIKRESENSVRFAKSRANIYKSIFVGVSSPIVSESNSIVDYDLYQKNVQSQKLFRKIESPINEGKEYETQPGTTGIFINGVELLNYKSRDKIYYGPIESIEIVDSGSQYDILNPPTLEVSDSVGFGFTGYCSVKGSLQEIRIIDPGFDYLDVPKIKITGGNGVGAKANVSMKSIDHAVLFNSESTSSSLNLINNSIGFSTYHKFRNYEKLIYRTEGQVEIGGMIDGSVYYASVQDEFTIKLHRTFDDSVAGINTISLTSYGIGNHSLESFNKKSIISSINIEESGTNYENKKRTIESKDLIVSLGSIRIRNHGFESGEIVKYTTTETVIGGLSANEIYYVTKIDENNFKLSKYNYDGSEDFYYKTQQYVQFTSSGDGVQIFNYPEIKVEVIGKIGISSVSSNTFQAELQPIFKGEISSIHIENGGVGYGSSEILNFEREPLVTLNSGFGCKLIPIINDGKIVEVLVDDAGSGYNSPPSLTILSESTGVGAVLTPIIENGQVKSVKILEGGIGYDKNKTKIIVNTDGTGFKPKVKIKSWTVNLVEKYFNSISNDDGFIFYNPISKYNLQYSHLYAPRKLRECVYAKERGNINIYGKKDLQKLTTEISSDSHSPIIGWAYDGNPIYGPYAYSKKDGGVVTQMKSGYKLSPDLNRPPYPLGFFVEDYKHFEVDDDSILDKYNGRFCVTPDFPNGTYAYFATIDTSADSSIFDGYRVPQFPYLIGDKFKSSPNQFNFNPSSNQDDYDLSQSNWRRNSFLYNLSKNEKTYEYIDLPNDLNQTVNINYCSPGSIENVLINFGGTNYKIDDKVIFDEEKTDGYGFASKVSKIKGKDVNTISVASTVIYDNEIYSTEKSANSFYVQSDTPYQLKNGDIINISGLSTSIIIPQGFYVVSGILTNTFAISDPNGLSSVSNTGIVTYVSVSGNIAYSNIRENDIFSIGNEKVKILNIDKKSSRIRILREIDGTVGTSHSYSDILYEIPRRFIINSSYSNYFNYKLNKEIYFNPQESLGIGTISGPGIGTTVYFSNYGSGESEVFVPTKTIYIPGHNLETGDSITYFTNGGSGILVSKTGIGSTSLENDSILYVAKVSDDLIGISTVKVGIGSTGTFVGVTSDTILDSTLYFVGIGTGVYHSFKTNYSKLIGQISRDTVTVSTASSHGLSDNDEVFIKVTSGLSTNLTVKYDDYNRKVVINPVEFTESDVDSDLNTISILNHKFKTGQKVSFSSTQPSGDLINNNIYYILVQDKDKIKLTKSYYDSVKIPPQAIGIGSTSNGILSPINPPITAHKNSSIIFDVSDESLSYLSNLTRYSAFKLNFYTDSDYTQIFDTSRSSSTFEVQRFGRVGIDANATVTLKLNDNVPSKIFYKLDPIYNANLPIEKAEISEDNTVISNNEITITPSSYNGTYRITSISSTSFSYDIVGAPEVSEYNQTNSSIYYETTSKSASGPISDVAITSKGNNYYTLPKFSHVVSIGGTGAILDASSESIGKIKKVKINDIGFDFPSDTTLRPLLTFPQIVKVDPLNSIDTIRVKSVGRGYISAPKLIVIDGKTNEVIPEISLKYSLDSGVVTILENTYSLNDIEPTILPIQNSNGVGISSIFYNDTTKDVTVLLSVGFSTANTFPFSVGDRVLIENTSVGIASTGIGYNSKDYGYKLFTINSVDENIGGIGTISYNISEYLNDGSIPGNFVPELSSGRIIPEKYFPVFETTLRKNNFFEGEKIRYLGESDPIGIIDGWNPKTNQVRISSKQIINPNRVIKGVSSGTEGLTYSPISFETSIELGAYSKYSRGWETSTGFLNNSLQRIQDNFYYQNFSYSLKSRVPYDTWENAVGSLNHTAGFKKFSDYQLESTNYAGISTDAISKLDFFVELDSVVDLNCIYDFDIVRENSLQIGSDYLSDEVLFKNKILSDYFELISNRVLSIDDISSQFNSDPRPDIFVEVDRFRLSEVISKKYITCVKDRRFFSERQIMIVTLLHNETEAYLNQYAKVESYLDLGYFDFRVEGDEGVLLFYPTKNKVNDYDITHFSYNLKNGFSGLGNTSIGGIVDISTNTTTVASGTQTTIVSIGTSYTSSKVMVEVSTNSGEYQYDELNVVHDGTNVYLNEYGNLLTNSINSYSGVGFGTYSAYFSGPNLNIDFIPNVSIAATVNSIQVSIANTSYVGVGTITMKYAEIGARTTEILSSISPSPSVIFDHFGGYYGTYYNIQISDITNNRHEFVEIVTLNDDNDLYLVEFGNTRSSVGLGTFGIGRNSNRTELYFTPIPNIESQVKVYSNYISDLTEDFINPSELNENSLRTNGSIYYGTESDFNQIFALYHKNYPLFKRFFVAEDDSVVNLVDNTIFLPNHFFVSGEKVKYSYGFPTIGNEPISIASTDFGIGIGITDKLPEYVHIIRVDQNTIKIARNAEDALREIPIAVNITSTGVGINHSFTSINQNAKALISIDNIIQSPIVSTGITSKLSEEFPQSEDILFVDNEKLFFSGDFIQINNEIVKVRGVGIGSTNSLYVRRSTLGTNIAGHSTDSVVTKISGSYNIVDNFIHFASAPYGNIPFSSPLNQPDERDWVGVSTNSTFHGRVFLRTGATDSSNETYYKNYVFDDFSTQFNGDEKTFRLTSNNLNTKDIYLENAIVLINDIFQEPGEGRSYVLSEDVVGITSISFVGTGTSTLSDINTSGLPRGGVIVSVGSTEGFGYQPLVAAGGTAVVSSAGTISSVSIGNSGSGYRTSIQTPEGIKSIPVRVGVAISSTETPNIEFIGTATVSNGNIVSIAITNPGIGYTTTNPPYVIIDPPISYSNIPLIHSTPSVGSGVQATIDIVVGQGSSVIDFEIKNLGYNYSIGDTLTIETGGIVGIPTLSTSSFKPFEVTVQQIFSDKFNGWSVGELQVFDKIERLFNGNRTTFPLSYQGSQVALYTRSGSPISIQDTLLVFMNDLLQVPGESYIFNGGSRIEFTEPPREGDTCKILFYKGSGEGIDVLFVDAFETIKEGDEVVLTYDPYYNQNSSLLEDPRTVTSVLPSNVETNPYFGPGNTLDESLYRPVNWCRQTEDKIINELEIGKNRSLYEPSINPSSYLISPLSIGSTILYVDNLRPFFDAKNESQTSLEFQKSITLISKDTLVASSATAVVSTAGTISSIIINDGGFGYESAPGISIQAPTGITTITTTASCSISAGIVTSISITGVVTGYSQQNPPSVLIDPPSSKVETNSVRTFEGDSGIIVGVGTTTLGTYNQLIMDLYIPNDSYLKDADIVGIPIVQSSLETGDFFVVYNSNVGIGTTLFSSIGLDGYSVGISTQYIDNVYQVTNAETLVTNVTGVGNAFVRRVFVKIVGLGTINFTSSNITFDSDLYKFDNVGTTTSYSGTISTSNYFGNYSWGKIGLRSRSKEINFNANVSIATSITSSTEIRRLSSLKYTNYII